MFGDYRSSLTSSFLLITGAFFTVDGLAGAGETGVDAARPPKPAHLVTGSAGHLQRVMDGTVVGTLPFVGIRPVQPTNGTSYAPSVKLNDHTITLDGTDTRIWFEGELGGWVGTLETWQIIVDEGTYSNGVGADLARPVVNCTEPSECGYWDGGRCNGGWFDGEFCWVDEDCFGGVCENISWGGGGFLGPGSWCTSMYSNTCDYVFMNRHHPRLAVNGINGVSLFPPIWGSTTLPLTAGEQDDGGTWYAGNLVLDAIGARGTYTVKILDRAGTFFQLDTGEEIPIFEFRDAIVEVPFGSCCDFSNQTCVDDLTTSECDAMGRWTQVVSGQTCAETDCRPQLDRYISFVPPDAGGPAALAVDLVDVAGYPEANGRRLWVGPPWAVPDEDSSDPNRTFPGAGLQCDPYYADWNTSEALYVYGAEILPMSVYEVSALPQAMSSGGTTARGTGPIVVDTGAWGDVAEPFFGMTTARQPDFKDISELVAKFVRDPAAPTKALTQLQPNVVMPWLPTSFKDIAACVSAFVSVSYDQMPFATGPCDCPSRVPCGLRSCATDFDCPGGRCIDDFCTDACSRCGPPVVVIDMVPVGNPGNAGELSGAGAGGLGPDRVCGAVDYTYDIGKYEVTAGQYTAFLNAVAADDTYGLYNELMSPACGIERLGSPGSYSYSVAPDWADRPVNFVSWGDAARFANWLHNGQLSGAEDLNTTEDGSYLLDVSQTGGALLPVVREPDATWVIPSEDEWYKAAYHYNDGVTSNYYDYPTAEDVAPGYVNSSGNLSGTGTPFEEGGIDPGNYATYEGERDFDGIGPPYYRTQVGEWENSGSPYGTFDQGGNVSEWTEEVIEVYRLTRGGSVHGSYYDYLHAACRCSQPPPSLEASFIGFRLVKLP